MEVAIVARVRIYASVQALHALVTPGLSLWGVVRFQQVAVVVLQFSALVVDRVVLHIAVPPALVAQVLVQVVSFVLLQGALPLRHQVRAIC